MSAATLFRVPLRTIVVVVALATSALLASCGTSSGPTSGGGPTTTVSSVSAGATAASEPLDVITIIRYGEKPDGSQPGVDANGHPDDSSLTRIGWDRAHRLTDLFAPPQGTRNGLTQPTVIYAASANASGEGLRTRETVQPLADRLGVKVNTRFGKGEEKALVEDVLSRHGATLICWQHGEIPAIVEAFPAVTPAPPTMWPDDRFDVVWTLTRTDGGWHFAQLPELALPQDLASVI